MSFLMMAGDTRPAGLARLELQHVWRWIRRRRHSDFRRACRAALLEACAVVNGHAADIVPAGQELPCWVWLNALAHGSTAGIRAWAVEHPHDERAAASLDVAAELERLAPDQVVAIQSTVFLPAELAALGADRVTAAAVVHAVLTGVAEALRHAPGTGARGDT